MPYHDLFELQGHIADALRLHGLGADQTLARLQDRADGATPDQLLGAALVVARDLADTIRELEVEIEQMRRVGVSDAL